MRQKRATVEAEVDRWGEYRVIALPDRPVEVDDEPWLQQCAEELRDMLKHEPKLINRTSDKIAEAMLRKNGHGPTPKLMPEIRKRVQPQKHVVLGSSD